MSTNLVVHIVRYVDDSFPGWVEGQFVDSAGQLHTIVDKVPCFTTADLDPASAYPQPGEVCCKILSRSQDALGRTLVHVSTDGFESTEGLSEFTVLSTQLSG